MLGRRAARHQPRAFLTLPTGCGAPLSFAAAVGSWQAGRQPRARPRSTATPATIRRRSPVATRSASTSTTRGPALSVKKASSASGFVFRLNNDDQGLTNPRGRIHALPARSAVAVAPGSDAQPFGRRRPRRLHARPSSPPRPPSTRPAPAAPTPPRSATSASAPLLRTSCSRRDLPRPARRPGHRDAGRGEPLRLAARGLPGRQVRRPRRPDQRPRASSSPTRPTAPSPPPSTTSPSSPIPTSRSTSAPASGRR